MFTKSEQLYDAIQEARGKDYAAETRRLHALIVQHKRNMGNRLLDVACGTGSHLAHLRSQYEVEGLDLDERMLEIGRGKCPSVTFHQGDMTHFDLGRRFDVVVCLFSSIGYAKTLYRLHQAIQCMAHHVHAGGLVIIEPWLTPETFRPGPPHALFVDQPELKIARMYATNVADRISTLFFHYLVATATGIGHFTESHELGLFAHSDYVSALASCGLEVIHDAAGLTGRGLYIGIAPGEGALRQVAQHLASDLAE